jgi:hypothetical protein
MDALIKLGTNSWMRWLNGALIRGSIDADDAADASWSHKCIDVWCGGLTPIPRSSKMWLIVDMRYVNKWIDVPRFSFEGLHNLKDLACLKGILRFPTIWLRVSVTQNSTRRQKSLLGFFGNENSMFKMYSRSDSVAPLLFLRRVFMYWSSACATGM